MASMVMDPVGRTSASSIAAATVLSVVNIDDPSAELNLRAGGTNGALCIVTQNIAGINAWTIYCFDSASSGGANTPYVVAALTSGQWIAVAGKYVNSALNVTGAITSVSTVQGTRLISTIATGTAPFSVTSTTQVANLNVSQLVGGDWTIPGTIGSATPNTGAFTTINASGAVTSSLVTDTTAQGNGANLFAGGVSIAKSTTWSAASRWGLGASILERSFFECSPVHADNAGVSVFGWDFNPSLSNANSYEGASIAGSVQSGKDVATWYGFRAYNTGGTGTISATQYGFHCAALTKGAVANYAFFSAGAGLWKCGDTTDSTSLITGAFQCSGGGSFGKRLTLDGATGKTLRIVNGVASASVAVTFGSVGPTGSTAGNPQGWMRIDINGTDRFIPFW